MSQPSIASEISSPDISHLVTEDDTPVDNFQSEKQQRLLVEPLYSSRVLTQPFIAAANVGLFYGLKQDPIVPDAFLSLGVQMPADWSQKQNRSYFVWEFGKVPEVCIEIVSNREGKELSSQKSIYSRIGVTYYAVFDPLRQLQTEMEGELLKVWGLTEGEYRAILQPFWLQQVGLGLTVWDGRFEDQAGLWLRWCNPQGDVILTGAEDRDVERLRADAERQRAETERQRAETERQRADAERQRAEQLAERLRQLGLDPNQES